MRLHSVFPRHEPKFGRVLDRHPSKVLTEQIEEPCSCRLAVRVYAVLGTGYSFKNGIINGETRKNIIHSK